MTTLTKLLAVPAVVGALSLIYNAPAETKDAPDLRSLVTIDDSAPDREGPLGGYSAVVEQVAPSVVSIYSTKRIEMQPMPMLNDPFLRRFFGDQFEFYQAPGNGQLPQDAPSQTGLGSGVIISSGGYILTNNHVIDGADEIKVRLPSRRKDYSAQVVGRDPSTDLAVIKLDASDLPAARLGDSANLKVGDTVLAIGNPFNLNQTVTSGIVSALGRDGLNITGYENFIQTDASINPGNSGGALIDNKGRVVGINTAIYSRSGGNVGIGFAIPINMVVDIADKLIEHGEIRRGFLGVLLSDVSEDLAKGFGVEAQGALVNEVSDNAPASAAGMKAGDIMILYKGKPIEDMRQARLLVANTIPGETVDVTVIRDGKEKELKVTIGELSTDPLAQGGRTWQGGDPRSDFIDGVSITDIDGRVRARYRIPQDVAGVLVTKVEPGSKAASAGLRAGEIISEVARQAVTSVREANAAADSASGDVLLLRVVTESGSRFLAVEKP